MMFQNSVSNLFNWSKRRSEFIGILICLCLAIFHTSCKAVKIQEPVFIKMTDIKLPELGLKESILTAQMKYYNPNKVTLRLDSLDLFVLIFERTLGKAALSSPIEIPSRDTFFIPVKLTVDMGRIIPNMISMGFNKVWDIRVIGKARLNKGRIRLLMPIDYKTQYKAR